MYDGLTGQLLATVTNAQSFAFLGQDSNGNIIGYYANSTSLAPTDCSVPVVNNGGFQCNPETFNTAANGPTLEMYNLTAAIAASGQIVHGLVYFTRHGV